MDDAKIGEFDTFDVAEDAPLPSRWEPDHVGRKLVKAFRTLDRLPRVRGPREPGGHWVRHATEWADQLAQAELPEEESKERAARQNALLLRPTGVEIKEMDVVLEWLRALREVDSGMALVTTLCKRWNHPTSTECQAAA
jgi:hypothetical protein